MYVFAKTRPLNMSLFSDFALFALSFNCFDVIQCFVMALWTISSKKKKNEKIKSTNLKNCDRVSCLQNSLHGDNNHA